MAIAQRKMRQRFNNVIKLPKPYADICRQQDWVGHQPGFQSKSSHQILPVGQLNILKSIGWLNPFGRAISPIDIVGFYFWYGGS
jgi:hypothetical protein